MNKIYRVIWSRAKHCYVVVSEMAKSRTKSNGSHVVKKTALAAMVLAGLSLSGMGMPSYAADNIIVDSGTAAGTTNTVTDDTTVRVVGTDNKVTNSKDAEVFGDGNTVTDSKSQTVIGDKNSITGRNSGTVSGKQEIRTDTVSDLVIGKGNSISGNNTYMKGYESLTIIGNNNTFKTPNAGIVIGDNQINYDLNDSVIIGSLTPEEKKAVDTDVRGMSMTVVGNHAQGGAGGTALGWGAQGIGAYSTVTGFNSASNKYTSWSSIYGVDNKITGTEDAPVTMVNGAFGTMNKVDYSSNSMVWGTGNWVTNAGGNMLDVVAKGFSDYRYIEFLLHASYNDGYSDHMSETFRDYASLNGGSVFAMGNSNTSNYARRSSIIGSGNTLNGTENAASDYNTIAGYQNTGTNVNNASVMGTGNILSDVTTDVVIGDYHTLSGGSNNIIIGSMETKDGVMTQLYTPKMDINTREPYTGTAIPYTMKVKTAVKAHTENISNAVMVGYNTDVQYDGGVALGSNSIASVDKGALGYNPVTGKAFESEAAIVAFAGKEDRFAELNSSIPGLASALSTAKADYESKLNDYLTKSDEYSQKVQYYNFADAGSAEQAKYKQQMEAAKSALDAAETAMNTSETAMNAANKAYTAAVSEKTQITSAWQSNAAAVSVGDRETGMTRQITNVAAGTEDTDAVNVAQLKSIATKVDANSVHYFSTKSSRTEADTNYANDGATGTDSIVIGISSKSDGNNSAVLGNNTTVTGVKNGRNNSIVVGHSIEADGTHNAIFATDYNNGDNKLTKVFGEQNTVLGVGNLVGYTAVRNGNNWIYTKNNSGSDQNVAVGLTNTVSGGSVVIGTNSVVQALGTSIGHGNNILGDLYTGGQWRVAVGNYITAKGDKAVAIGNGVNVNAWGAIGIGANDPIGLNRTIVTGKNAMAIGSRAQATDENALALGFKSIVTGKNATAIGTNANASEVNGVALGSDSVANTAAGISGYDPSTSAASTDTTSTWKATRAAVSVGGGTSGYTRQITNVAAGFADTDAVNVAQLKKVQTQLDSNSVHYFSTKSSQTSTGTNYLNDGATGTDSMVIGISSKSSGNNSTVLGNNVSVVGDKNNFNSSIVVGQNIDVDGTHNAVFATDYENGDYKATKVFGEQNTVLGVGNLVGYTAVQNGNEWTYTKNDYGSDQNVAVGLLNTVSGGSIAVGTSSHVNTLGTSFGHGNSIEGSMLEGGQWRVALGNYLTVKGEMGLAIGNAAKVDGDWAIAIGNNNHDEEKTTSVKGESSIAMGTATTVDGGWATAIGSYSEVTGKSATAVGSYSIANGERATAFGNVAQAKEAFSLAVGAFSTAEAGQSVAIGGYGATAKARHSVALGSFSTADRAGGILGYDPLTKKESTSNTAAWKSVLGAVSVGGQVNYSDGTTGQATRQITNVAAGSADTDAVNVAQLKQVQQSISDAVKEGKTTIEAGDNITVEKGSTKNSYKITAKDTTLKDSDSALSLNGNKLKLEIEDTAGNKVSGSVELDKIGSAIDTKNTIAKGKHIDYTEKANDYGGTEYTLDVVTDGKVESGNTGIVTGDTVYQETRVAKDGEYVKQSNSAAENLSVLDSQVKTNTESITNISNNVTNLNSRVSNLDTRINRVGAGAAALAALHPQDYDPTAKWDFAAGYGNYKSANAVAIGAFYRPTNDVLFSIGTSMGGGENMFNAGVSFKFGSSNEYSNYSKDSLAAVVSEQSKQLEAQHSTIEALQTKVEKQEQENQELRAQVQEIMRQLSAQR